MPSNLADNFSTLVEEGAAAQASAIQLPWNPSGTRPGSRMRASGWPSKSWAERITRSVAPRSGSLTYDRT